MYGCKPAYPNAMGRAHTFGNKANAAERMAVIDYLKT